MAEYRETIRNLGGGPGTPLYWARLDAISRGEAYTPILADGREGEPIQPSLELMRLATLDLLAYSYGKPTTQGEALSLERQEMTEDAAVRALSAEDLEARAAEILRRRLDDGERSVTGEVTLVQTVKSGRTSNQ